jgi:hypothetical protein
MMSRPNAESKNLVVVCTGDIDQEMVPASPGGVYNGQTQLTPKFASIQVGASGSNAIVAAVSGKKIRVLAYTLFASGAVNAKFQSAANDKTGLKYFAANGGISAAFCPVGWFETNAGEALNLNLSGAVAVGGELVYAEV